MRKIEQQIQNAIRARAGGIFSNTATVPSNREDGKPILQVLLHGSLIASIAYDENDAPQSATGTLAGWDTRITRSRLSLVARALGDKAMTYGPCHRKGAPAVARKDGSYHAILRDTEWFGL